MIEIIVRSAAIFFVFFLPTMSLAAKGVTHKSPYLKGMVLEREEKYMDALQEFLLVPEEDPLITEAFRETGNCYYRLGDNKKAVAAYSKYLATHPEAAALEKFVKKLTRKIAAAQPIDPDSAEEAGEKPVSVRPWRHEYPEIGGSLGTPAGFNLILGYEWNKFGVRVSGGGLSSRLWGAQANFLIKVGEYRTLVHHASLLGGLSEIGDASKKNVIRHWNYGGVGYDINWYGAFFEFCMTAGSGDFSGPQAGVQLGYVYRFNK